MKFNKFVYLVLTFFTFCCIVSISSAMEQVDQIIVLTKTMPDTIVASGGTALIYGNQEDNHVTIESDAGVILLNFIGNNTITIKSDANLFTVSRNGATVIFEGTDGTKLKMPATMSIQEIIFNDIRLPLIIKDNQVMLGNQIITLDNNNIEYTAELIINAEAAPISGIASLTTFFSCIVESGNAPYTYSWDFGDGSDKNYEQNPTHVYDIVGTYTATVTVVDDKGQSVSSSIAISVEEEIVELCPDDYFWYDWLCYSTELLFNWGLGYSKQEYYHHNDKDYEWYINQANTGSHSGDNCGPSSVTMAIKWHDATFDKTAEDARNMYRPEGGWWWTYDITNYLDYYLIPNDIVSFQNKDQLIEIIKNNCIVILCIDTSYIRRNYNNEERIDRFYDYGGGHFLVVKGVREIDNNILFEVYDPNNWYAVYSDNSEKGKNRHYRAYDLTDSIANWWNYLIVVYPSGGGGKNIDNILTNKVDPTTIKHMWGK